MKKFILFLGILASSGAFAQTKIKDGTVSSPITPNAAAIIELESNNKGLLLTRVELTNTTTWGLAGTGTQGMMVYNTSATISSTDAAYPVITGGKGVYYWDGTGWVATKLEIVEPWKIQGTTSSATANTDNIYQNGNVAIGFTDADSVSGLQLEVKGEMKASVTRYDGRYNDYNTQTIENALPWTPINGPNELFNPIFGPSLLTTNKANPDDDTITRLAYANVSNYNYSGSELPIAQMGARSGNDHNFVRTYGYSSEGVTIESTNHLLNKFSDISVGVHSGIEMKHETPVGSDEITISNYGIDMTASIDTIGEVRMKIDPTEGVIFDFGGQDNYVFPKDKGIPNQILTTTAQAPNGKTYLTWKDVKSLIGELPVYANDAAADSDTNLPSGGLYKLTGSRVVHQKP